MFKKLLANLPFNPSLIDQVSFYHARLRQEVVIRRLGFVMMVAAMMVQFIATLYPAQPSLAASPNDVLDGITNKNSILNAWDSNAGNIRAIYGKFGITRENIAHISGQKPNATVRSTSGNNFWSVGRLPLNAFGISSNKWGERTLNANGVTIYQRPLHAWDSAASSSYEAFKGVNSHGKTFWILKTCGNPTFVGSYLPAPPKPKLTVHKTLLTSNVVHRGDTVKFRLEYQNTKPDSLATRFKLKDTIASQFEFVSLDDMSSKSGSTVTIQRSGELGYSANPFVSTLVVRVKNTAGNNQTICNSAIVTSDQSSASSERPCVSVIVPRTPAPPPPAPTPSPNPTPPPTHTSPPPPPNPSGYCIASSSFVTGSNKDFNVRTSAYAGTGTHITGYNFDVDGNGTIDSRDKSSLTTYEKRFSGLAAGEHTVLVYVQFANSAGQTSQSEACQAQINIAEDARVVLSKSVTNVTKNGDANGTTVQNGDVLEFKLSTQNVTATDYKDYEGQDYFGSVLQYADIADQSQLAAQGLSLDSQNNLHWQASTLKGNTTDVKTIRVKVKDITPTTNTPSKLSPDYDCKITNDYGNEVTMNVDCPVMKSVEQAATNLPNTGPGTTVAIAVLVSIFVGYLYSRSRIMSQELAAVRNEYTASGGF
jgi:hypothetical protein